MKEQINEIKRMQQLAGIINESQLDEISPELARSAFDSSIKYFNDNPNASDTDKLTYQKKVSQANTFAKHVNPNNIETANKIAKLIDVDYRAEIKKNVFDGGNEQQVRVYFGGRSANIIITIRKNDYKINTDVSLSEPVERRLITFIKQIQNTELVDAPTDTQELEEKKKARFMKKASNKPAAAPAKPMAPMPRLAPMPRATKPEAPKSTTPPLPPKPIGPAPSNKGANPSQKGVVQQGIKKAFDAMLAKDPSLKSAITMNATNDGIQISFKPASPTFDTKKPSTPPPTPKKM